MAMKPTSYITKHGSAILPTVSLSPRSQSQGLSPWWLYTCIGELCFPYRTDTTKETDRLRLKPMQTTRLEFARWLGIKTTRPQFKFSTKFDHRELYEVNSIRDVRVVNNLPHGTLS